MKGEASFEHDGKRYVLKLDVNALCTLEEHLGVSVQSLGPAESQKMTTVRAVFWAALTGSQPDITVQQAGAIMTDIGVTKAVELVGKIAADAFPDARKGKATSADRPRNPAAGVG